MPITSTLIVHCNTYLFHAVHLKVPLKGIAMHKPPVPISRQFSNSLINSSRRNMTSTSPPSSFPSTPYTARHGGKWPYTPADFDRQDPSPDDVFYQPTRLVTHIDDQAISKLTQYYALSLPPKGKILDLCSSWVSHYPPKVGMGVAKGDMKVIGMGMNKAELEENSILTSQVVKDLNEDPTLPAEAKDLNAATCVVSIDYLTRPVEVLKEVHERLVPGGEVHLAISNRCFPTKAIRRWLRIDEEERLRMVGDYLWFAGFRKIDIFTLSDGAGNGGGWFSRCDPLWVVRGRKEG